MLKLSGSDIVRVKRIVRTDNECNGDYGLRTNYCDNMSGSDDGQIGELFLEGKLLCAPQCVEISMYVFFSSNRHDLKTTVPSFNRCLFFCATCIGVPDNLLQPLAPF